MTNKCPSRAAGFTLLEVLVAVLLLSIGLLGLASLQTWGLRATGNATYRSQATLLVNEMVERIRANQPAAIDGYYVFNSANCNAVDRCFGTDECTSAEIANADYYAVVCGNGPGDGAGVDDVLPNGTLAVNCGGGAGAQCDIEVAWQEVADMGGTGTNNAARESALRLVFVP